MPHPIAPIELLQALNDETRLRIVALLSVHPELCVCDLVSGLDTHQPKVSRHLAILRRAGIVLDRRAGQWIYYRLSSQLSDWGKRSLSALTDGQMENEQTRADLARLSTNGPGIGCSG